MSSDFIRIFMPRLEKASKAIKLLENGARYQPTEKQADDMLRVLMAATQSVRDAYGGVAAAVGAVFSSTPTPVTPVKPAKDTGWGHWDISLNVSLIPPNQLSSYVTQITARMCEAYETREGEK